MATDRRRSSVRRDVNTFSTIQYDTSILKQRFECENHAGTEKKTLKEDGTKKIQRHEKKSTANDTSTYNQTSQINTKKKKMLIKSISYAYLVCI